MTSSTLIDHIITNKPENISKSGVIHTGISDHSLIYAIRKINYYSRQNVENIFEIRNMKKFHKNAFCNDLSQQLWDNIYFFGENPNDMWGMFKELFLEVLDKHAPLQKKKTKSKQSPWVTNNIKTMIYTRDKLKRKAIISKQENDWVNYKKLRNETNMQLKQAKQDYYSNKITNAGQNPKNAWKTINHLLGKESKQCKVNELLIDDKTLTTPDEIAEGFNNYFSEIGPNLAKDIDTSSNSNFKKYLKHSNSEFTAFQPISVNSVYRLLCELPSSKASGVDKISSKIIKIAAPIISNPLTYIFNQSMTQCIFPNDWKVAKVTPIFKNGKRNLPGNYRPISVLPAISKIMERIMYTQLYNYLSENNLLSEHQFGFRKNHSTATALLDCTNDWYINMDRKLFNLVVFIDLKKAFDTVDHQILLSKLELYGIKGNALLLLKSYLSERKQKCHINGHFSSECDLKCGVPQGSILGPLFFLIYINDLSNCLNKTQARLFADDTNVTATGINIVDVESAVNADLENLRMWLLANKLSLNVTKTEFMIIGSHQKLKQTGNYQPVVKIGGKQIKQVNKSKTLGVVVDQHLNWSSNTENICKKISTGLGAIRRVKEYVDKKTLLSIYHAIIQPYFNYCCEVWNVFGETQCARLQKLHNRAARILENLPNEISQENALLALNWKPLNQQRKIAKAKIMFKILNDLGPKCLKKLFTLREDVLGYNVRNNSGKLCLPQPRTNSMKKSLMFDGAQIWNSLPSDVRNCKSFSTFKRKIAACLTCVHNLPN